MSECRRTMRLVETCLVALTLWLALTVIAAAHATLVLSTPTDGAVLDAAPGIVALEYNEPVSPLVLNLVRPDGSTSELSGFSLKANTLEIELPGDLARGTHLLSWRVVSADGHPIGGTVLFSVGEESISPPHPTERIDWAVRSVIWLGKLALYAGLFFGVGGAFSLVWLDTGKRNGLLFVRSALALGIVGAIASASGHGLDALDLPVSRAASSQAWEATLSTSFGLTLGYGVAAMLIAALAQFVSGWRARLLSVLALAATGLALALSGHASAAEPQWLMRPAVFLHAGAVCFWVGALVPLALALKCDLHGAQHFLSRFSRAIPFVVGVLVVSGFLLVLVQVEVPAALIETAYGNLLLVKLALLLALFTLAAFNRWRLTRPVQRGEADVARRMVRSITAETVIVVVILAVVAGWRFTPPPRSLRIAADQPVSVHIHSEKAMANVDIEPGRAGKVSVNISVLTGDFAPLHAREVTLVLSNPEAGIEPIRRKAHEDAPSEWIVDDLVVPLAGDWSVEVNILIGDFESVRLRGNMSIR